MNTQIEIELTGGELVFDESINIEPLTELQVLKMFMLLQTVEGFRFGLLETVLLIELNDDEFKIESSLFDVWDESGDDDVWTDGVIYEGKLSELDRMNTYENRFYDSEELDRNPISVVFEYEVIDGKISEPDDDTHYGSLILSDENTVKVIEKLKEEGFISDNETGMVSVYDDMIVIEVVGGENIFIPKKVV